MHAYNETCFLTGLPVRTGDPVKALFLVPDGSDKDDPASRWKPAAMPMSGTYDGKGAIENIKPDAGMLRVLRNIRITAGKTDVEITNALSVRALAGCASDGEVSMLAYRPNAKSPARMPVVLVMAHEWAWSQVANSNRHYERDVDGNKALERAVAGTIRSVVRHSCKDAGGSQDISVRNCVLDLASLMAGMGALGITFHPMAREDNRPADTLPWKAEFYKNIFLHALFDGRPDAADLIGKLSARIDWILEDD